MNKIFYKKNNGINLAAPIITIILLVLAGISIVVVTGENGIIAKEKLAEENQDITNVNLNYEVKSVNNKNGKIIYNILIIVQSDKKVTKVEYGEQLLKADSGVEKIAIDFEAEKDVEYKFKITTLNGKEIEKTIIIDYIPIELDKTEIFIGKSEKNTLTVKENAAFSNLVNSDLTWESLDENIAKVSDSGEVEGINIGKTTIVAKLKDENGEARCIVNVCEKLNLEQLVDDAKDGDTIEIPEGTYILEPVNTSMPYMLDLTQSGINDKGKALTFVGKNEKTKLIFYGSSSTLRDGNAIQLANSNSIVRNLIFEFHPNKYTDNAARNAIFSHSKGKIYNVYFKIENDYATEYTYTNHDYLNILISNCTFYFKNTNLIEKCYGGGSVAKYQNILTNYEPVLATEKTNILTKDFKGNIEATKTDSDVINRQAGVYFGQYAWD